jgi:spore coat protein U-like protein
MKVMRPNTLRRSLLRLAPVALAIAAPPLYGQPATTTIAVSATVLKVCVVSVGSLAFGNYLANSGSPTDSSANITVTCTTGTTYTVALDAGLGSGATTSSRKMTFSSHTIDYGLYQDSSRSTNWGNNVGTDTEAGTGSGSAQTLTVYGRIPIAQYLNPGAYTDTVTVTVNY